MRESKIVQPTLSRRAFNKSESANPSLWDGLVGAWVPALGVQGNRLVDVSGNGNVGTMYNMTNLVTNWIPTKAGIALNFDGTDDLVSVPDRNSLRHNLLTIFMWVYVNTTGNRDTFISCGNSRTFSSNNYIFCVDSGNRRISLFPRTPTAQLFGSSGVVNLAAWNTVAFSADGTNIKFWVNGQATGSATGALGTNNTSGWYVAN